MVTSYEPHPVERWIDVIANMWEAMITRRWQKQECCGYDWLTFYLYGDYWLTIAITRKGKWLWGKKFTLSHYEDVYAMTAARSVVSNEKDGGLGTMIMSCPYGKEPDRRHYD